MSTKNVMTGVAAFVLLMALAGVIISMSAGDVPWWGFGGVLGGIGLLVVARRYIRD